MSKKKKTKNIIGDVMYSTNPNFEYELEKDIETLEYGSTKSTEGENRQR